MNFEVNKPTQLMAYFSIPERKVTTAEYREFWAACTAEDKEYFKNVNLETGLLSN